MLLANYIKTTWIIKIATFLGKDKTNIFLVKWASWLGFKMQAPKAIFILTTKVRIFLTSWKRGVQSCWHFLIWITRKYWIWVPRPHLPAKTTARLFWIILMFYFVHGTFHFMSTLILVFPARTSAPTMTLFTMKSCKVN